MRGLIVLIVLWMWGGGLAAASVDSPAGGLDGSYEERRTFHLKAERGGGLSLTSEVEIAYTYRSERSTRERVFFVAEPFYTEVSKLRGTFRGRKLDRERIGVEVPELRDVFMTSGRLFSVAFPDDIEPGDIARFSYREAYDDAAYMPILYVPNVDHVSVYEVEIEHPREVGVELSFFYPREALSPEVDRFDPERTVLRFRDLEGGDELPYFAYNAFQAAVLVRLVRDGSPITPTPAAAFSAWYRDLVGELGGADLGPLARSLERATPRQSVAAIHDHVRSSIRYVADERAENAIVPRAPGTVLANGYGDCKDRAFLAAALARELGIEVDVVLVATEPAPEFEGAHIGLYDHMIGVFADDEGEVFFDPTHRHLPFGTLPEPDVGAQALVVHAEGGRLLRVPAPDIDPLLDLAITGSLDEPASARAEVTVRGELAAEFHRLSDEGADLDIENFLAVAAAEPLRKISLDGFILLDQAEEAVTFSAAADLSDFIVASPTRRYVPHTPFRAVDPDVLSRADDDHALYFSARPRLRLTLDLAATGFAAADEATSLGEDGPLSFSASLSSPEAGRVHVEYVLHQAEKRLAGATKAAYLDAADRYLAARRAMFILRPVEPSDPAAPPAPAGLPDADASGR